MHPKSIQKSGLGGKAASHENVAGGESDGGSRPSKSIQNSFKNRSKTLTMFTSTFARFRESFLLPFWTHFETKMTSKKTLKIKHIFQQILEGFWTRNDAKRTSKGTSKSCHFLTISGGSPEDPPRKPKGAKMMPKGAQSNSK